MSCADIMTADPLTARDTDSVADAAAALIAQRYINLPVVDDAGCFKGMFGLSDLLALLVPRVALAGDLVANLRFIPDDPAELRKLFAGANHKRVGEACDRQAVTLHPDTPEVEAIRLFCRGHNTLAVVARETNKLVGIVSYWDAIRAVTAPPA
ncbi:MAG: CBS domain-containing protein [Pseudomonadota bacterium]|nr:CBS domain-containing protein [Pseudomonadota bacterium]